MGWVLKRVKGLQVEGCGRESRHIYGAHWTFKGMKFMFPRTQAKKGLGSEKSKKVACIRGWGIPNWFKQLVGEAKIGVRGW